MGLPDCPRESLPVEINDKWGVIDREGKWLVQPRYHSIRGFNNLDTAIYSTDWDQHGLMDAQGNTLTDDSYHPYENFKIASDFQLISFEGYSKTSFFSPRGARPIKQLNAHKVGTLSGFNQNGLSIANLASNREWGLISVEGVIESKSGHQTLYWSQHQSLRDSPFENVGTVRFLPRQHTRKWTNI